MTETDETMDLQAALSLRSPYMSEVMCLTLWLKIQNNSVK